MGSAGRIGTREGDCFAGLLHLVVVFLEVQEDLTGSLVQGIRPSLLGAISLKCVPFHACFWSTLYLRPQSCTPDGGVTSIQEPSTELRQQSQELSWLQNFVSMTARLTAAVQVGPKQPKATEVWANLIFWDPWHSCPIRIQIMHRSKWLNEVNWLQLNMQANQTGFAAAITLCSHICESYSGKQWASSLRYLRILILCFCAVNGDTVEVPRRDCESMRSCNPKVKIPGREIRKRPKVTT